MTLGQDANVSHAFLSAFTDEARTALGGPKAGIVQFPFRIGRESRARELGFRDR